MADGETLGEVEVDGDTAGVIGVITSGESVETGVTIEAWVQEKRSDRKGRLGPIQNEAITKSPPIMRPRMAKIKTSVVTVCFLAGTDAASAVAVGRGAGAGVGGVVSPSGAGAGAGVGGRDVG